MSRHLDSPVQTQMAVAVFDRTLSSEYHGSKRMEGKNAGLRRIFVQTDSGSVLPMELDRVDNAHTVKRRLQLAFNLPTEETSLSFGDVVLKNDLSGVQNDSPLLLTRSTLHRSSSTPCLSPTGNDIPQRDKNGPVEILGGSSRCSMVKQIAGDVTKAIKTGVDPIPVHGGLGGAYYFQNTKGESIAIVKPTDEEPFAPNNPKGFVGKALGQPGLKRSVRVGETGYREVAAYLLDKDHFASVPPTVLVKITHSIFNMNDGVNNTNKCHIQNRLISKIASMQQFVLHDFDASDHGTSNFPVTVVHRIGILDVRIFNTDRHAGNLLVRKLDRVGRFGQVELIPIDHGLCLPESLEDPYFEWIHWPQASIPFSEEELEYIASLDPYKDSEMLRAELPMIREACLRVLILSTVFLKEAASNGLCLAEIGEMMSREFRGRLEEEPSGLELVCIEARRLVAEREAPFTYTKIVDSAGEEDDFLFDIDSEESLDGAFDAMDGFMAESIYKFGFNGFKSGSSRSSLSKLEENVKEEETYGDDDSEVENIVVGQQAAHWEGPSVSKLSMSLKGISFSGKKHRHVGAKGAGSSTSCLGNPGGGRGSANDQLPTSATFVKVADMDEEEWGVFMERFQELLPGAFAERKGVGVGQRKKLLRMGTSCQF